MITECRTQVGAAIPIILRWSQWNQQDFSASLIKSPAELESFLKIFVDAGVDILDASQGRWWEAKYPEVDGEAGWCKKLSGLTPITVGSAGL